LLAACVEYHHASASPPFPHVNISYLFDSPAQAFDPERAAQAGYAHLPGDAKRNVVLAHRLEARVRHDYPQRYERCLRYLASA